MTKIHATTLGDRLLSETMDWPASWKGVAEDVPLGYALVKEMLPFLQGLVASGAAPTTLRRHFSNAWVLGGYIVRQVAIERGAPPTAALDLILEEIDENGGPPMVGFVTDQEQRSFDSTCRYLSRFLRQSG
ncbi:MAG: hypothetical protein EHM45_17055 [Desulfobacteraceae bacterium]|nr:MAG: hypothetical protein EHM45_17055 [Desulfobacteraceae bacterium]